MVRFHSRLVATLSALILISFPVQSGQRGSADAQLRETLSLLTTQPVLELNGQQLTCERLAQIAGKASIEGKNLAEYDLIKINEIIAVARECGHVSQQIPQSMSEVDDMALVSKAPNLRGAIDVMVRITEDYSRQYDFMVARQNELKAAEERRNQQDAEAAAYAAKQRADRDAAIKAEENKKMPIFRILLASAFFFLEFIALPLFVVFLLYRGLRFFLRITADPPNP